MSKDPEIRLQELEELVIIHPHFNRILEECLPNFKAAFDNGESDKCFQYLKEFLLQQKPDPLRQELLDRLQKLKESAGIKDA